MEINYIKGLQITEVYSMFEQSDNYYGQQHMKGNDSSSHVCLLLLLLN